MQIARITQQCKGQPRATHISSLGYLCFSLAWGLPGKRPWEGGCPLGLPVGKGPGNKVAEGPQAIWYILECSASNTSTARAFVVPSSVEPKLYDRRCVVLKYLVPLRGEKKSSHAHKNMILVPRVLFKISNSQPRPLYMEVPSR